MPIRLSCDSARALLNLEPAGAGAWARLPDVAFCLSRDEHIARLFGRNEQSLPPDRLEQAVRRWTSPRRSGWC